MERENLPLRVDVLGPLSLHVHGAPVEVPGRRRQTLLALLALAGDRGVGTAALVDSLWPEGPPNGAVQALYSHVSRLRGHLGPLAQRLERSPDGYRLRLEPGELDVDAARRWARSDPRAALGLWRGPALLGLRSVRDLEVAAVGLDELRLRLVDDVLEARLDAGERDVTVDAVAAATASPLRERTTLQLVRSLAAEGRTAEAMAAAQAFRRRLVDETGLDPGRDLAELEQQVAAGLVRTERGGRRVVAPDTPMLGRQQDREEVVRLQRDHAVLTLTGPGGVGKTRLALDVAADAPAGEAVVVPLAGVDRDDRVLATVVAHLDLRVPITTGPDRVAEAVADRRLLLVLDNCEHVVRACRDLVTALRRTAPDVRVLATSRTTLHAPDEHVVRLRPLPVPRAGSDLDSLRRHASVRAFVEHARRRGRGDYELVEDDAADLVDVLRRLDGLPLGIELAARQAAVLSLREVRARLDRALDLSTGREGPLEVRQRTLRATIESSYRLLDDEQQWLLRATAPFIGGVDLDTVEALVSHLDPAPEPVELLHALVDCSLLVADGPHGRYRPLFVVRTYVQHEAARLGETEEAEARFVDRARAVAEHVGATMAGPDEEATDRLLRAELDNLRRARDRADGDTRASITLAVNRVATWRDLREVWEWALDLADDPAQTEGPQRVCVLAAAAEASRLVGDLDGAVRLADRAVEAAGSSPGRDDRAGAARARSVRAVVAHFRGSFATARDEWLRAAEDAGPDASAHVGSAALATAYEGDADAAGRLLDRARRLATCASHEAFVAYVEGEITGREHPDEAVAHYRAAIAGASRVGCTFVEGVARVSLASTRARIGDVVGAASDFDDLIAHWRRTGQATQLWTTARNAADLLATAGRTRTAVLLLVCAGREPGAAAVDARIARFSGRAFTPLEALAGEAQLADLRREAERLGASRVLDLAQSDLRGLA